MELQRVAHSLPDRLHSLQERSWRLELVHSQLVGGTGFEGLLTKQALISGPLSFDQGLYFWEELVVAFDELEHTPPFEVSVSE